ncbi:hypothetical protein J5H56_01755 [Providencia rettgeri]|uniref:hypothetical protein n=1 Tax=Providencia rettgeri TaxID=587 RepID=UPI001AAF4FF6|nr:hypothetical protein [Providencia rettgeri]MBO2800246.1 hypothetical protein [Providencia rettgeri]
MSTSLIARQLPEFVNDAIGVVSFGPKLLSHTDDILDFNGHKMTLEEAMKAGAEDTKISESTSQLVRHLEACDPNVYFKHKTGFLSRIWDALTGSNETRMIEFTMNCRRVDRLVVQAPLVLEQAHKGVHILLALEQLSDQQEYGLTRLAQRILNLEVTKASSEMNKVQVGMLLHSAATDVDLLEAVVKSAIPIWHHQIKQLRSGAANIDLDPEVEQRFRILVNKLNDNVKKDS